uniref:G-protein coupled receptors family 1 profile domain-containing protein n=1 Tax=Oryzias sinensis TaxID=183150 RepID=A0A8C7ZCZ9_9TELE
MEGRKNITFVRPAYFKIVGFIGIPNMHYYYVFLFFVFFVSVLGNTTVMALIYLDHNLRSGKYVAIFNLAFVDLLGNTALALNLVALCYDRLIAILYPLHYQVRVTPKIMLSIVAFIWLFVLTCVLIALGLLTRLSFCDSVVINSFYCDHGPMYRLACNDQTPNLVHGNLLIALILWVPLIIIVSSYVCIGHTLAKISTAHERIKAFKTCTAHLSLVAIYFIPEFSCLRTSAILICRLHLLRNIYGTYPPAIKEGAVLCFLLILEDILVCGPQRKMDKRSSIL